MRMEEDEKYQVEGTYTLEKGEFPEEQRLKQKQGWTGDEETRGFFRNALARLKFTPIETFSSSVN